MSHVLLSFAFGLRDKQLDEDRSYQADTTEEEIADVFPDGFLCHGIEVDDQEGTEPVKHGTDGGSKVFRLLREELRVHDPGQRPKSNGETCCEGDGGRDGKEGESLDSVLRVCLTLHYKEGPQGSHRQPHHHC